MTARAVSSSVVRACGDAVGASFTAITAIVTVALLLPPCPSEAVKVNESKPL